MANPAAPAATPAAAAVHAAAAPAAAAPAVVPALPAAAPAVAPARRVNRRNYTLAETLSLIEAVEEILPLCGVALNGNKSSTAMHHVIQS